MKHLSKLFVISGMLAAALLAIFSQGVAFASGGPKHPPHQTLTPLTSVWPSQHENLPWVTSYSRSGSSVQQYCFNPARSVDDQYVVYVGTESSSQLHIFDVSTSTDYATGQYSYANPGVTCFQSHLWIDWPSKGANNTALNVGYWVQTGPDTGNLTGVMQVPGQTTDGGTPAMAVGGSNWSTLYVGWVGSNSGRNLNIEQSTNGTSWTNQQTFGGDSTHQYAGFTLYGDNYTQTIYASWVSSTSTPTINLAQYNGTNTWAWHNLFASDYSPYAPGIEAYNGKIYFVWTGGSAQNTIANIYTGCWTGSWHGGRQQSDQTTQSVSMDGDGTNLVTAFTATDNNVVYTQNWYNKNFPSGC